MKQYKRRNRWWKKALLLLVIMGMFMPSVMAKAEKMIYVNAEDPFWVNYHTDEYLSEEFWEGYFDEVYWINHEDAVKTPYWFGRDDYDGDNSGDSNDDYWDDSDDDSNTDYDWDPIDESIPSQKVFITEAVQVETGVSIAWKYTDETFKEFALYRAVVGADGSIGQYENIQNSYVWDATKEEDGFYHNSVIDENVELGIRYSYRIRGYYYEKDAQGVETYKGDYYTSPVHITVQMMKPVITSIMSKDESGLVLEWESVAFASKYQIFRSDQKDGTYQQIAEVGAKNRYRDEGLKLGKRYYYKITAVHQRADMTMVSGPESEIQTGIPTYSPVKIQSTQLLNVTTAKLTWDKYKKGKGYEIFRAECREIPWDLQEEDLEYKKIKTIRNANVNSLTVKHLQNGYTYFYKVRVIGKANGKELKGEFSKIKKRTMNVLAYGWEPWEDQEKRIFGKKGMQYYKSAAEAQKHMKTITIKTWDIGSSGKKYTRTWYLTVHEKIAPTVQQIFKEIYEGKEKFPIHDIGGYSWRGDNSTSEHCWGLAIDINANENYMIDGDTPKVGSFWKPGKNPYSIPLDGEVATIMQKYGFSQGLWGYRRDYMHFSYFGG